MYEAGVVSGVGLKEDVNWMTGFITTSAQHCSWSPIGALLLHDGTVFWKGQNQTNQPCTKHVKLLLIEPSLELLTKKLIAISIGGWLGELWESHYSKFFIAFSFFLVRDTVENLDGLPGHCKMSFYFILFYYLFI